MSTDQSLRELISSGVELTAREAVAIAQELIASGPTDARAMPPFGPPSLDNVQIYPDGSVECLECASTPAVSEIARLLDAMLPRSARPRVPSGLRYTIARALLEVDAPPFDSLAAFSAALARHEDGDRTDIVRQLYARAVPASSNLVSRRFPGERRRMALSARELRWHLREADEALFRQMQAAGGAPAATRAVADAAPVVPRADAPRIAGRAANRWRLGGAVAALIAFGAGTMVVGEITAVRKRLETWSRASSPNAWHGSATTPSTNLPAIASAPAVAQVAGATPPTHVQKFSVPPAADQSSAPASIGEPGWGLSHGTRPRPVQPEPPHVDTAARIAASRSRTALPSGRESSSAVPAAYASSAPALLADFASTSTALFLRTGNSSDARGSREAAPPRSDDLRVMTILDDGAKNYHVRPSPEGNYVAFDSDRDGERGVYVAERDGSAARRVSGPGFAALPSWSPDGTTLAFIRSEAERPGVWNLWIQDLAGGRARRLTSFTDGQTSDASWFPDGQRVCYTHDDHLIVRDLETGSTRAYVSPLRHSLARSPAVSPDGSHVIFQVSQSGGWLLDLHDGSMRWVLTDPTAEEFTWSPDGRRVAYRSVRDGQWGIWRMPVHRD